APRPPRAERSTRPRARRRRNGSTTWNPPLVRFVNHHITLKWGQTPFISPFFSHFSHMRILLTHSPEARALYYGERALAGLRKVGDVKLHEGAAPLEGDALIAAAADCELIVSYRQSPGPAELFQRLPKLVAFVRCAIDIRNVDVGAASKAGVLVTQASAGFVTSVAEQVFGFLVDLSRGITRSTIDYRAGRIPPARMGRELKGSTLGVIGYGAIGKEVVRIAKALGMKVLINDPYKKVKQASLD